MKGVHSFHVNGFHGNSAPFHSAEPRAGSDSRRSWWEDSSGALSNAQALKQGVGLGGTFSDATSGASHADTITPMQISQAPADLKKSIKLVK